MSLRDQLVRFGFGVVCAVAAAGCGGGNKTTTSGTTASVQPVSGIVRIKPPAAKSFVRLTGMRQLKPGTVIDARAGVVKLTAASLTPGETTPSTATTQATTTRPTTTHTTPTTTRPTTTQTTPTTTQPTTTQTTPTTTQPTTTQTTPTTTQPTTTHTTPTTTQQKTTQTPTTRTSNPTRGTLVNATLKTGTTSTSSPGSGGVDPVRDKAVGDFQGGEFEVLQNGDGVVDLKIHDTQNKKTTCSGSNGSTRLLGALQGNGTGRFQTRGDRAAASVSGTDWEVQNRCDGTLIIVRRGTVKVTDFRLHKTVTLHQGQTYLAKAAS